jgi:hypothetical protein
MALIKAFSNTKTVSAIIEQKTVSASSYQYHIYGSYPLWGNEPGVASNELMLLSLSRSGDVL